MATYTLTGPTSGVKGITSTLFTLTPSGSLTDTINFAASPVGTFAPSSLSWAASSAAKTFTFTPNAPGLITLTLTSTGSNAITGSPWTYTATPAYLWLPVQSSSTQGFTSALQLPFNGPVKVGDLLVVSMTMEGGPSAAGVTDSAGNTYAAVAGAGTNAGLFYAIATVGGTITVTAHPSGSAYISMAIAEYSSPPGAPFSLDGNRQGGGSGTAVSLTSLPITTPDLVVMAVAMSNAPGAAIPGAGFATRQMLPAAGGLGYGTFLQDWCNPPSSPVALACTISAGVNWDAAAGAFLATMPYYSLIGPANVAVGSQAQFYLIPTGTAAADTVSLSSNLAGTFSPPSLSFGSTPLAVPFGFTPSVTGLATITLVSSGGHSIGAAPWSLGSFVNLSVSGPTKGIVSTPYTFTLTPAGTTTDTISYDDGGGGGTFSPPGSLTFPNTSVAQTVTYTPGSGGSHTLTFTSADGATISGSPISFLASNVFISPLVVKSGTLAMFMTPLGSGGSNGNWPLAVVTGINTNPTFKVNGVPATFGPPVWKDVNQNASQVAYRAMCGGVRTICLSSAGHGYTAPTCTWNGDGGGSGHTVGTPAMATGVTSYTVTNPGSGITGGSTYWQPGNSPGGGYPALAWVNVSGGQVTSVVPRSGSCVSIGGGYSSSFSVSYQSATITCNVSQYISGIPVTAPGTGFTSPPTYTITDSTGSGAVAVPSMALAATDVVTYSVADNWLATDLGTPLGATDAVIPNFVGVLEGPSGHVSGFRDPPTTKWGGEHSDEGQQTSYGNTYKNKMSAAVLPFSGPGLTSDSAGQPLSWDHGGTITCAWGGSARGIHSFPFGVYTVVYDDPFTDTTTVTLNTPDFTFIDSTPPGVSPVIQHWQWNPGVYASGILKITSSSGTLKISMPWVFAPGNTIDRSNKFAVDDALVANFTNSNGSGPCHFRCMSEIGGFGISNLVDVSDIPAIDVNGAYVLAPANINVYIIVAARFLNTNPAKSSTGDNTYPWPASTKLYSSQPWANSGTDAFGNYLDMTNGPLGANDNGNILGFNPGANGDHGVVEFRTSSPHGLKTGQLPYFFTGTGKPLPFVSGGSYGIPNGANMGVFVTGPSTFAVLIPTTTATPALIDKINSTAEIPFSGAAGDIVYYINIPFSPAIPYEHQAEVNKAFPGSNMWFNVAPATSDALIVEWCNRIVPHLGPTNGLIFEVGDESWNSGSPFILNWLYLKSVGSFVQAAPHGQPWLTYATGGSGPIAQNFGSPTPMNCLLSAHQFAVFKTRWVALGRDPSKLILSYGGRWQSPDTAASTASTVLTYGLPQTNTMATVAPYTEVEIGQTTINQAYTDAGNAAVGSPGNWPVDAINDFERHINFYNRLFWYYWATTYAGLAGTSMRLSTYEGSIQSMLDWTQGGGRSIPNVQVSTVFDILQEDCMNHPSWADRIYAYLLAQQRGDPTVANSGAVYGSYLNLWSGGQLGGFNIWWLQLSPAMPTGLGLNNSFMTPQGGFNGSHTASAVYGYSQGNQGPGFKGFLDFNAAAATPTPTPTPTPTGPMVSRAAILVTV